MNVSFVIPVLVGLLTGWLVNYFADTLPLTRRFSQPTCRNCQAQIQASDYLLMRSCKACGKSRSLRSWLVHVFAVITSVAIWLYPPAKLGYILGIVLLTYFGVVFVIDMEHRLIMHPVSIFGAILGLGTGWLLHGLVPTLLGGLGGFLIMLSFYLLGTLFARIRAHRMKAAGMELDDEEALGAGDVILSAVLGLILGWPLIWFGLLLGILIGGLVTIPMVLYWLVARRYRQDAWMVFIPYGPFLLISAALMIYLPNLISSLVPK